MSLRSERSEITGVLNRLLDNLSATMGSRTGPQGIGLRHLIGDMRANYFRYLKDQTFPFRMMACFNSAYAARATLASMVVVRKSLIAEAPTGEISQAIVKSSLSFCLSVESKLIMLIVFTSRDDVDAMITTMRDAYAAAIELAADSEDQMNYQALILAAGALTNYLANTARPLPQMVTFSIRAPLPALTLSNRFYYTAARWQELVNENKIIHPAFCPMDLRGLAQ